MAYGNSPPPKMKTKKKSPPKGFHKMPDGTLMKDSAMELVTPSTGDKPKLKQKPKGVRFRFKKRDIYTYDKRKRLW